MVTKSKKTNKPKKPSLKDRARTSVAKAAERVEEQFRKDRTKVFKRLRPKFPGYVSDADLLYAIRVAVSPDEIGELTSKDDPSLIRQIKQQFDFKADREPLGGRPLAEIVEVLSHAAASCEAGDADG